MKISANLIGGRFMKNLILAALVLGSVNVMAGQNAIPQAILEHAGARGTDVIAIQNVQGANVSPGGAVANQQQLTGGGINGIANQQNHTIPVHDRIHNQNQFGANINTQNGFRNTANSQEGVAAGINTGFVAGSNDRIGADANVNDRAAGIGADRSAGIVSLFGQSIVSGKSYFGFYNNKRVTISGDDILANRSAFSSFADGAFIFSNFTSAQRFIPNLNAESVNSGSAAIVPPSRVGARVIGSENIGNTIGTKRISHQ